MAKNAAAEAAAQAEAITKGAAENFNAEAQVSVITRVVVNA